MAQDRSFLDRLFGFAQKGSDNGYTDTVAKPQQIVTPTDDDGTSTLAVTSTGAGFYGTHVDFDASARSESELIGRYRDTARYPDVDTAVEHIVSDAIAADDEEDPIGLNLDDLRVSDSIKKRITESFDEVLDLLGFRDSAHDIFRRWYIDGRIYYQKIVDPDTESDGITALRYIDPRKIRKVRNINKKALMGSGVEIIDSIEEFYFYNDRGIVTGKNTQLNRPSAQQGLRLGVDSVAYAPSGLVDLDKNLVLSYLDKAIKPVNMLKMMEDAMVVNRLARAPERRIFYVDTGSLPRLKAEQYIKDVQDKYKNKIVYDSRTGEIRDDRKTMSMLEDYWIPRREGGRGTEIDTLPGASNLDQIGDIKYLQNKLFQSLQVPIGRLTPDQTVMLGQMAEVTRDELVFAKFVGRLRKKFNVLFDDLLRTQLVLKKVISEDDWNDIRRDIKYMYAKDSYLVESKDSAKMSRRLEQAAAAQPFIGTLISADYVRRNILKLTDDEIKGEDKKMQSEAPPLQPDSAGTEAGAAEQEAPAGSVQVDEA